jgi:hypothetical protein
MISILVDFNQFSAQKGVFSKTTVMAIFIQKWLYIICNKNCHFFPPFLGENSFKIITSVPDLSSILISKNYLFQILSKNCFLKLLLASLLLTELCHATENPAQQNFYQVSIFCQILYINGTVRLVLTSTLGAKFDPKGLSWPLGMKFEVGPQG